MVLEDILADHLTVVFCGINPGLQAAAQGHHFTGRSNRFWRTLHLAGFTPQELRAEDDRTILHYRCGLTAVVDRPTARADQLSLEEFHAAAANFERKIAGHAPRFVAFLGKAAYCALFAWKRAAISASDGAATVRRRSSGICNTCKTDIEIQS